MVGKQRHTQMGKAFVNYLYNILKTAKRHEIILDSGFLAGVIFYGILETI